MSDLEVIGGIQVVIIVLLIQPQKRRERTLEIIGVCVAVGLIIRYVGPSALGLLYMAITSILEKLGWLYCVLAVAVVVGVVSLYVAYLADMKENRAIRAGSKEAFDKRVSTYIRHSNYSEEAAIAATIKIRDAKKN